MHRTMGTKAQIVSAPEDFEVLLETFWIEHQFQKAPIPIFFYFPCSKYLTILPCGCNECSVRPNERSHIHTKFIVIPFIGVRKSKWALILKLINHFKRRFTLQFTRISSIQNYSNSYHIQSVVPMRFPVIYCWIQSTIFSFFNPSLGNV